VPEIMKGRALEVFLHKNIYGKNYCFNLEQEKKEYNNT
jgi:hypothetical protein